MDPIEPWLDRNEIRRLADALLAAPSQPREPDDATYGAEFEGYDAPPGAPAPDVPPPLSEVQAAAEAVEGPMAAAIEQQARQVLAVARTRAERGGLLGPHELVEPGALKTPGPVPVKAEAGPEAPSKPAPIVPPPVPPESPGEEAPKVAAPEPVRIAAPSPPPGAAPRAATPFVTRLKAFGNWLRQGLKSSAYFLTDRDGGILVDEVQSPKLHQVARTLAQASRTANRQAGAAAIGNLHIKISPERSLEVIPVTTRYGPMVLGIIVPKPIKPENVEIIARALQQVMEGSQGG